MTKDEINEVLGQGNWAMICTVGEDLKPYAIEATYFLEAEDRVGFMINPRGTTIANISSNASVLLKITFTSPDLVHWLGVSCFGRASICTDIDRIRHGWELLGDVMNKDYRQVSEKFCCPGIPSPFLIVHIEKMTGRCSWARGESIDFKELIAR